MEGSKNSDCQARRGDEWRSGRARSRKEWSTVCKGSQSAGTGVQGAGGAEAWAGQPGQAWGPAGCGGRQGRRGPSPTQSAARCWRMFLACCVALPM